MAGITVRTFRELLKRKLVKGIGLIALLAIVASMVIFFAIPPGAPMQREAAAGLEQPVVKVGEATITEGELQQFLNLQTRNNLPTEYGAILQLRYQTAQNLATQLAMTLELEKQGYEASRAEIEAAQEEYVKSQLDLLRQQLLPEGKGDDRALEKALRERDPNMSLRRLREQLLAETPELLFRFRVVQDKFLKSLREKYNPTDEQVRLMFEQVYPARIFVSVEKHKDKAEARIKEAYAALKAGTPFAEVVNRYSDDPDAIRKQGGRLPGSGYYEIQEQLSNLFGAEVANRVMAFKPNKDYTEPLQDKEKKGYYIYALAERKLETPPDFDEKKDQYRQAFINMRISNEQQRVMNAAMQNYKIQFVDPLLAQYDRLTKTFGMPTPERLKTLKEVNDALTPVVNSSNPNVRLAQWLQILVLNQLVQLHKEVKDKQGEKQYQEQLTAAVNRFFNEGGEDLNIRLMRAEMLIEQGKKQEALNDLEVAQGLVARPPDFPFLFGIAELYEKAGRKDLAQQAQKRAQDLQRAWQRQQEEQQRRIQEQIEAMRKQEEARKRREAQKQGQSGGQTPAAGAPQSGGQQAQSPAQGASQTQSPAQNVPPQGR
ncbi:MAG: SurA N-terminal domain-containing protein [Fimbriimonadales bacterium]|nr:SurA N-terminal domain-containing protein [Fimbriimonadales bacterium]